MHRRQRIIYAVLVLTAVVLSYPVLFHKLGDWPILKWDEARNAVNTLEMHENGAFYVRYFDGEADAWETKPPLLMWAQCVSTSVWGVSEWSLRLPSALSALGVIVVLVAFFGQFLRDFWGAGVAALFLLTCDGFVKVHVSRTADHDALLCFWLILGALAFFVSTETTQKRFVWLCAGATFAAVFTKSIVGLMLPPAWLLYVVLTGQLRSVWRQKTHFWALLSVFIGIAAYYAFVEWQVPGQWSHVANMELWSRYQNKAGQYLKPDYWAMLRGVFKYPSYVAGLILSTVIVLLWGNARTKRLLLFSLLNAGFFVAVFSFGVQYDWYDAPVYPFLALSIAAGMGVLAQKMAQKSHWSVVLVTLLTTFTNDYGQTMRRIDANFKEDKPNELFGDALRFFEKKYPDNRRIGMLFGDYDNYYAPMLFYQKWYAQRGFDVALHYLPSHLPVENSTRTPKLSTRRLNVDSLDYDCVYITTHPPVLDSLAQNADLIFLEKNAQWVFFKVRPRQ